MNVKAKFYRATPDRASHWRGYFQLDTGGWMVVTNNRGLAIMYRGETEALEAARYVASTNPVETRR